MPSNLFIVLAPYMATITKANLAANLVERVGLSQKEAKEMVDIFFEEVCQRPHWSIT